MTLDLAKRYLIMSKEDMSGLDEVFNVDESPEAEVIPKTNKLHLSKGEDVDKDYEYARGNLYSLIDKGQEAVNGALDLAMSSDHPRAYEVAGQLIKNVGDVADKLMALQKDKKNVKEEGAKKVVTNNAFFMGSTADLQKMLKQASKKKDK
tara:strand:- start:468 stop:917 length:450 start_codon:yes stop_codon:yes gene_type:complete